MKRSTKLLNAILALYLTGNCLEDNRIVASSGSSVETLVEGGIEKVESLSRKVVGAYVQLENGKFRVAWAPVFAEYKLEGGTTTPNCTIDYFTPKSRGKDEWKTNTRKENWMHIGSTHYTKKEFVENGKKWNFYRILHLNDKNFVGIYFSECPSMSYKGLSVWKSVSTEWGLVLEVVDQAGYLNTINQANLLGRTRKLLYEK